ncbi:diflavin oxidoreductase [Blattabacterium cuenoti]|uniref:diflavin oxidoreductase n=1 Tax=Blattabacterium cuenoti TaxID=1653831 RepID=UPI00163B62A7|nr:flavodoxin domain-containing protein [Blattabacterium cuenoti]
MLSEFHKKIFLKLIKESSKKEIGWMCGYMSGFLSSLNNYKKLKKEEKKITLVYGTETGNAKNLAFNIYQKAKNKELSMKLIGLDEYRLLDLEKENYLFIIISTHGEGAPPSSAKSFFDFIHQNKNLKLNNLKYSVLALGDQSYSFFCKAGEDIDKRLHDIGALRIIPLYKCDVDYEYKAEKWFLEILNFFLKKKIHKKNRIICGKILSNIILNDKKIGSNKEIHHIEILVRKKIKYLPGDSIGIFSENSSNEVDHLIKYLLKIRKDELKKEEEKNKIFYFFKKKFNILFLSENFLKKYSFLSEKKNIPFKKYKLINLLKEFPIKKKFFLKDLIKIMEPIKPKLYSISSSPKAHLNEIHITVSRHHFQLNGEIIYGHCSDFLSKLQIGEKLTFFIYNNKLFKLPNLDKNIILIGPGTGIAPFRSFLYEREIMGATGKNWLFFGDQYFSTDFLYQTEIQNWKKKGILHRVSLSFSRDQNNKIYVQDKIWENRIEFFSWIKNGAYVYICGKKNPMSIDVEKMIHRVIQKIGKSNSELFINNMIKNGKYIKDVY